MTNLQNCRACSTPLSHIFVDLGLSPISNAMRHPRQAHDMEPFFPLRTYVCDVCKLVQIQDIHKPDELFTEDYTYFSSFSESWLQHAKNYAQMIIQRFKLDSESRVIEIASNDGYLLQYFKQNGIHVLGIDPAANVAKAAKDNHNIDTWVRFFNVDVANELVQNGLQANVITANNVLAHVPDLNDFIGGLALALKPDGVLTVEFPHLLQLIEQNYFDTIYHEHYSYLSLLAVERVFARHSLSVFDVDELTTHGGSLRVYASLQSKPASQALINFRKRENAAGLDDLKIYGDFAYKVKAAKRALLQLLLSLKEEGKTIVGYGAPAKGNTLLNYCGIRGDILDYTVDRSPHKQNLRLPGTGIPVYDPQHIFATKPDYVLILPWNLKDEIMNNMVAIREWGGQFIVPLPDAKIL